MSLKKKKDKSNKITKIEMIMQKIGSGEIYHAKRNVHIVFMINFKT